MAKTSSVTVIPPTKAPAPAATYVQLRQHVRALFIEGHQQLEALKLDIYWRTGKAISDYLKTLPQEKKHTTRVLTRLSNDLDMETSIFYRVLQFAESYPQGFAARRNLTWSHYKALLTAPKKERSALEKQAVQNEWSSRRLLAELAQHKKQKHAKNANRTPLKEPANLRLHTYKKGALANEVDLGFYVYRTLSAAGYKKVTLTDRPDYFYQALLERVIDGDTIWAFVDLGFGNRVREKLRFRGVDTPELKTREGAKAKRFVEKHLPQGSVFTLRSARDDLYGRYLADLWTPTGLYLNNALLENNLAVRI